MKKVLMILAVISCVACVKDLKKGTDLTCDGVQAGILSVRMGYEENPVKSLTDYVTVLDVEKTEKKVDVLVFDKSTGWLAASKTLGSVAEGCSFTVPVGEKMIYAVVNGPDVSGIQTVGQLEQVLYDLETASLVDDGLFMVGRKSCVVTEGAADAPETVVVKRLVSRVVLRNISCHIPEQYGKMRVDCVFLGNAYVRQTVSGAVSKKCNVNGYAQDGKTPVGKNGQTGSCPDYFYRTVGKDLVVGASGTEKYHMYCQPDSGEDFTCMYLLVTIGGEQYYYRVPLHKGLVANTTCTVDVDIINLGSELPPDGDVQKGDIQAVIQIADWAPGEEYSVKF